MPPVWRWAVPPRGGQGYRPPLFAFPPPRPRRADCLPLGEGAPQGRMRDMIGRSWILTGLAPHRFAAQNVPHQALRASFPQGKPGCRPPQRRAPVPRSTSPVAPGEAYASPGRGGATECPQGIAAITQTADAQPVRSATTRTRGVSLLRERVTFAARRKSPKARQGDLRWSPWTPLTAKGGTCGFPPLDPPSGGRGVDAGSSGASLLGKNPLVPRLPLLRVKRMLRPEEEERPNACKQLRLLRKPQMRSP